MLDPRDVCKAGAVALVMVVLIHLSPSLGMAFVGGFALVVARYFRDPS